MLKKPDFTDPAARIFSGSISLSKTTDKQLKKDAETLVRKLLIREIKAPKTKAKELHNLSAIVGEATFDAVIDGLSAKDANSCLKRCDPGAPELAENKQAEMTARLKAIAGGAGLHPVPAKVTKKKSDKTSRSAPKPTFEALSQEGRRKR